MFDKVMLADMAEKKPFIKLNQEYPGILSLFMYDSDMRKNLSATAQSLLRRPSPLTVGERELIFAYTSRLNNCHFCAGSHAACAKITYGEKEAERLIAGDMSHLPLKLQYLLKITEATQSLNREELPYFIARAKLYGASDREIHDTVAIAAFACMCNRYVDALGTTFKPEDLEQGGRSLATYGYQMTVRRFFGEIFPQLLAKVKARFALARLAWFK